MTDIAGTTRDILEENINLQGISLNIMDTAGIRNTDDVVEKIGVDKARDNIEKADLILYVIDSSCPLDENDRDIFHMIMGKKSIILLNKSDLQAVVREEDVLNELNLAEKSWESIDCKTFDGKNTGIIEISAKNQNGINDLEEMLKTMFFEGNISFNNEIYITNVRHKAALNDAYQSLCKVNESIMMNMPEDFYSIDLMDAYESLGSITGETIGEDLVNEIFSKFCMGK